MEAEIETVVASAPRLVEEAFEEITGESEHRWGLVVLAFVLGVLAVTVVIRFANRKATQTVSPDTDATATTSDSDVPTAIESSHHSVWAETRTYVARSEAAMRTRVHHLASRVHLPRHASVGREGNGAKP
jgi:hypothetical protein